MERHKGEAKDSYKKSLEIQHLEAQVKAKSTEIDNLRARYHKKLAHKDRKHKEQEALWGKSCGSIEKEINELRVQTQLLSRENSGLRTELERSREMEKKQAKIYGDTVCGIRLRG